MTAEIIVFIFIQGLLFTAALMDIFMQEVYDLVWFFFIPAGTALVFIRGEISAGIVISLFIYFLIQEYIMRRVYGRADCHALWCCGLFFSAYGGELEIYTLHMTVTFILMCIHQLIKKNITSGFRLKKEIPMIPYILVSFWIVYDIMG